MTNAAMSAVSVTDRAADRASEAFALVGNWLSSDAMTELLSDGLVAEIVAAKPANAEQPGPATWLPSDEKLPDWVIAGTGREGVTPAQMATLRRALAAEQIAAVPFNFRPRRGSAYAERSQLLTADLSARTRARILDLTTALGLVSPRAPRYDRYDKTIVLGGGYRSPLLRARYAAQLRASGISLGEFSFLGSPRFLDQEPDESQRTADFAPGAADEFALMLAAFGAEFGLHATGVTFLCGCASAAGRCPNWRFAGRGAGQTPPEFTHERQARMVDDDGRTIGSVLSASTGRPPMRPDTSDTLDLWARQADPRFGQRVLVITTQVFVPFQTFDGLRRVYLPYGADIDTVGLGPGWVDRPQTAEYLLQESLSAIRSGRRLLIRAAEVLAG